MTDILDELTSVYKYGDEPKTIFMHPWLHIILTEKKIPRKLKKQIKKKYINYSRLRKGLFDEGL